MVSFGLLAPDSRAYTNPIFRKVSSRTETFLHPCIAEIVRTGYCRPDLILHVRCINVQDVGSRQAYKMFLSDGELVIQAVIRAELHRIFSIWEVRESAVVCLAAYELKKAKKLVGNGEIL